MLNILIPLAGKDTFKTSTNNSFPRILHEIDGKLLIERAAQPFIHLECEKKIIVAAPKKEVAKYSLDKVLRLLDDSIFICDINSNTKGAACSALLAVDNLDLDSPLIISNFEQVIDIDLSCYLNEFVECDAEAGVLTFEAIHPKWSYVKVNANGYVTEAAEKLPISRHAVAGLYYFKSARLFIDSAKNMIRKDVTYNGLFYISHTLNELILNEGKVKAISIDKSNYFHIHDEHALGNYEEKIVNNRERLQNNVHEKTLEYIKAFNEKDITKLTSLISPDVKLTDPSVTLEGQANVISYINDLFSNVSDLSFIAQKVIVSNLESIIEFQLILDDTCLIGVDVISWNSAQQISTLDAYLYETNDGKV